jgi:hypothetical protein
MSLTVWTKTRRRPADAVCGSPRVAAHRAAFRGAAAKPSMRLKVPASLSFAPCGSSAPGGYLPIVVSVIRSISCRDCGSDSCSAMLRAGRRARASAQGHREWNRIRSLHGPWSPNRRNDTVWGGVAEHVDRRHAYTERMPPACRRMPEARERDDANLREAGITRTRGRVPPNRRTIRNPQLACARGETQARTACSRNAAASSRLLS